MMFLVVILVYFSRCNICVSGGGDFFNVSNGLGWMEWDSVAGGSIPYPLNQTMFHRSYHAAPLSGCGFRHLKSRLDNGETITLSVYGGSVTAGEFCSSKRWGRRKRCAWPNRLQAWARHQWPDWKLNIVNRARGGFGADSWANTPGLDIADGYILETSVNGQSLTPAKITSTTARLISRLSGPILSVGLFRVCGRSRFACLRHCTPDTVGFVPLSMASANPLSLPYNPETCFFGGHKDDVDVDNGTWSFCKRWWQVASVEREVLSPSGVSIASYRDAVWPVLDEPPADLPTLWNGCSHPDTLGHELISHVVAFALFNEFNSFGPACEIRGAERPCVDSAVSVFDAVDPNSTSASSIGWSKFEDRPLKPGWISNSSNTMADAALSNLTFLVPVHPKLPSLEVMFLCSYTGLVNASMYIEGCEDHLLLDPIWDLPQSTPKTVSFSQAQLNGFQHLPCIKTGKPEIRVSFHILTPGGGKFKLLRIVGC